jgi:hypothetical protein
VSKVTFGPLIAEARNKIGDVVFFRNKGGAATRAHVMPAEPATTKQVAIWGAFSYVMSRFQNNLTDQQRAAWEEFGKRYPKNSPIGGLHALSPLQAFLRTNHPAWNYWGLLFDDPPLNQDVLQPASCTIVTNQGMSYEADNFNRADADNLGPRWTTSSGGKIQIYQQQAAPGLAGDWSFATYNAASFPNDQGVEITVTAIPANYPVMGALARFDVSTKTGYSFYFGYGDIFLYRWLSGAATQIGNAAAAAQVNDVLRLLCQGTQISVTRNGATIIGPVTDATIASGLPGIYAHGLSTACRIDDFQAQQIGPPQTLVVDLDPHPTANELFIFAFTPPLSAGIKNFAKYAVNIIVEQGPHAWPYDLTSWWAAFFNTRTPPTGTLITGKRIGMLAWFMNLANAALSQKVSASSIST